MSRLPFALLILALGLCIAGTEPDSDLPCTGDSGDIEPSDQSTIDRLIQLLQGRRATQFVRRLIKKRVKDPNSKIRKLLGFAGADPRNINENLNEAPMQRAINKDVLNILSKVVGQTRSIVGYLWHYGFIPKVLNLSEVASDNYNGVIPPCAITNAIKEFQRFNNLEPADGVLRKETRLLMAEDRCGNKDVQCDTPECLAADEATRVSDSDHLKRKRRYVIRSRKWLDHTGDGQIVLKYFYENMYSTSAATKKNHDQNMTPEIVKREVEKGLGAWTKVAPIHFVEVDDQYDADVKIQFGQDDHGESSTRAYFDGKDGILAHMYYPRSGRMHFDEAENFTASTQGPGINLEVTAAHEMGHGLGIKHTSVPYSLMNPYYKGYQEEPLGEDDIAAVQQLYGSEGTGSVVPLSEQRECVAGERRDNFKCVQCPVDTFSETADAEECSPCPEGGTTLEPGTSSSEDCIIPEEEFGALEEQEWLAITRGQKMAVDMTTGSLQVKTSVDLKSNTEVSVSLLSETGWIGSFRIFFRYGRLLYNLKHCTPTSAQPITDLPEGLLTGTDDVFDLRLGSDSLVLSLNGVTILDYMFSEGIGEMCVSKYQQDVAEVNFWKTDTASDGYRHREMAV